MDDNNSAEKESEEPAWIPAATTIQSFLLAVAFFMAIPWHYYYERILLWDDERGLSVFFGVISILNAVSLVVRTKVVEAINVSWKKIENRHVALCASYLGNTLFWGGLAIWCVHKDLGINRNICYLVTATGTFGYTAVSYTRWQITKAMSDNFVTFAYGVISVIITLTFLSGDNLF